MTDQQKNAIRLLRLGGKKYAEVADVLGLTAGSVKKYCQRYDLTDEKLALELQAASTPANAEDDGEHCRNCGELVPSGRRAFCSEACRSIWWRNHPEKVRRRKISVNYCSYCGELILDYKYKARKYCSHACYISSRFGPPAERQGRRRQQKAAAEEFIPVVVLCKGAGTIMIPADKFAALLEEEAQ